VRQQSRQPGKKWMRRKAFPDEVKGQSVDLRSGNRSGVASLFSIKVSKYKGKTYVTKREIFEEWIRE